MQAAHTMTKQQLVEHIELGVKVLNAKPKTASTTKLSKAELVERLTWLRAAYRARH